MNLTKEQQELVLKILEEGEKTSEPDPLEKLMEKPGKVENYYFLKEDFLQQYKFLCSVYRDSSAFHGIEIDDSRFVATVKIIPTDKAPDRDMKLDIVRRAYFHVQKLAEAEIIPKPTLLCLASEIGKRWQSANGFPEEYSEENVDNGQLLFKGLELIIMSQRQPMLFAGIVYNSRYAGLAFGSAYNHLNSKPDHKR